MNHSFGLTTASRESLLDLIGRQHGLIEVQQALPVPLQQRVGALGRKAGTGGLKGDAWQHTPVPAKARSAQRTMQGLA